MKTVTGSTSLVTMIAAGCLSLIFGGNAAKLTVGAAALQQDSMLALLVGSGDKTIAASSLDRSAAKQKASDMEKMVMALAKQAKRTKEDPAVASDTANLTGLVEDIDEILEEMMQNVWEALGEIEGLCSASLNNVTACPEMQTTSTYYPPGFDGDFAPLRTEHKTCRAELPSIKEEADRCQAVRESLINQEQLALDDFNALNKFDSPDECQISETDVEAYLLRMWETHFKVKSQQWWAAYYKLGNITANITDNYDCTDLVQAYYTKLGECQEDQLNLEEMACDVYQRTDAACNTSCSCIEERWALHSQEVEYLNESVYDLKWEYRAIKRMGCLLDAFAATDVDAAIDECIEKRWDTSVVNSTCIDTYSGDQKPGCVYPDVCVNGIQSIENPDTYEFHITEYRDRGITDAGPCHADCCTSPMYTWVLLADRWVTHAGPWYIAPDGYHGYFDMDVAKAECILGTTTKCFGVYDSFCNGPGGDPESEYPVPDPVKLVGHPTGDITTADDIKVSSAGSCVYELALGDRTTATTTLPDILCKYEVEVTRSSEATWKTILTVEGGWDDLFRFSGCTLDSNAGEACEGQGAPNGVRTLKTRLGNVVGEGVCCTEETNAIVNQTRIGCNGWQDAYQKYEGKKVANIKLLHDELFTNAAEAKERCLRLGDSCWGMMDYQCEGAKFTLVNGNTLDAASGLEDTETTCLLEKLPEE